MKSIIIHDWMLRDPKLNGYKLLIFATVYHFTSLGSGCFLSLKSWLDLLHCSKSQFYKARNELLTDKYLVLIYEKSICMLVCDSTYYQPVILRLDEDNELIEEPLLSWDEIMKRLTESDNETTDSDNETAESDTETLPY